MRSGFLFIILFVLITFSPLQGFKFVGNPFVNRSDGMLLLDLDPQIEAEVNRTAEEATDCAVQAFIKLFKEQDDQVREQLKTLFSRIIYCSFLHSSKNTEHYAVHRECNSAGEQNIVFCIAVHEKFMFFLPSRIITEFNKQDEEFKITFHEMYHRLFLVCRVFSDWYNFAYKIIEKDDAIARMRPKMLEIFRTIYASERILTEWRWVALFFVECVESMNLLESREQLLLFEFINEISEYFEAQTASENNRGELPLRAEAINNSQKELKPLKERLKRSSIVNLAAAFPASFGVGYGALNLYEKKFASSPSPRIKRIKEIFKKCCYVTAGINSCFLLLYFALRQSKKHEKIKFSLSCTPF